MKIAFHSYQLGERGTEICLYKYAKYNRELFGNESIIVSSGGKPTPSLERFKDFQVVLYDTPNPQKNVLEEICDKFNIDAFYSIKSGHDDGIMPENTKSLSHCVFNMSQPHGTVYAGVCKYLSEKFGNNHPYVHHILEKEAPHISEGLRSELNIPENAFVLGRHGGRETFDLDIAKEAIKRILDVRDDIWFVFLNTNEFHTHERIIYLPWTMDEQYKAKFVNTCDAMIHGRRYGEIFSLSTAEFSLRNKPIITWKPKEIPHDYETGHLYVLKDDAIYYEDVDELYNILKFIDKKETESKNWVSYCNDYGPEFVMNEFKQIFLEN